MLRNAFSSNYLKESFRRKKAGFEKQIQPPTQTQTPSRHARNARTRTRSDDESFFNNGFVELHTQRALLRDKRLKARLERLAERERSTILLLGLNPNTSDEDINTIFENCGRTRNIVIMRDARGYCNGTAYVEFWDKASLDSALLVEGTVFKDQHLRCSLARNATDNSTDVLLPKTTWISIRPLTTDKRLIANLERRVGRLSNVFFFHTMTLVEFNQPRDAKRAVALDGLISPDFEMDLWFESESVIVKCMNVPETDAFLEKIENESGVEVRQVTVSTDHKNTVFLHVFSRADVRNMLIYIEKNIATCRCEPFSEVESLVVQMAEYQQAK
ncbi:hypothetical protein PCE1_001003 [Barthelona sp. PCE]